MSKSTRSLVAGISWALLSAGLVLSPTAAVAGPLDRYTDDQLMQWLNDELSDLFQIYQPNQLVDDDELEQAILAELSDDLDRVNASPQHRAAHRFLTRAALDAEMNEADTSLRAVVHEAVLEADQMAHQQRPRFLALAAPDVGAESTRSDGAARDGALYAAPIDGKATAGNGVRTTPRLIVGKIREQR